MENCWSDLRVHGERKEELGGRWEVKEPSKDLGRQEVVRGIIQCAQSPECELERTGLRSEG